MTDLKKRSELIDDIKLSFAHSASQIGSMSLEDKAKFEFLVLNFNGILDRAKRALVEAESEMSDKVSDLLPWLHHKSECAGIQGVNEDFGVPCTCGLSKKIEALT